MRAPVDRWSLHRAAVLADRARLMRAEPSDAERVLWRELQAGKLGVVFRRQVVLCGRFIADFFAAEVGLVVEVDGRQHERRKRADARRDDVLRRAGYRVVRIEAEVVMRELVVAVECVCKAVLESSVSA